MEQTVLLLIDPKNIAGRQDLRDNPDIKNFDQIYKIKRSIIEVRPGFNGRTIFGNLDELSESIQTYGLIEPLTVDVTKDGKVYLHDGERRNKAMDILEEAGNLDFEFVPCLINKPGTTELDRLVKMASKNNGSKPFEDFEEAATYVRMLNEINPETGKPVKAADIAKWLGKSKMHVSNRLKLSNLTEEEKTAIIEGYISPTAMKDLKNSGKSEDEIKDILHGAEESGEKIKVKDVQPDPLFAEEKKEYAENIAIPPLSDELIDEVFSSDANKESDHQEKDEENFMAPKKGQNSSSNLLLNITETIVMLHGMQKQLQNVPMHADDQSIIENFRIKIELNLKNAKKMAQALVS